jgi:hypothetical protein
MAKRNLDEQLVFGLVPTLDGKPPIVMVGMPTGAWETIKDGHTQTFDLTSVGIPFRFLIYGGKDHTSCLKVIEDTAKLHGVPIVDERRKDWSIPDYKPQHDCGDPDCGRDHPEEEK